MTVSNEHSRIAFDRIKAAGTWFAGESHILLMQNHGFPAAINGIVSLAQLCSRPLCMLIALRGESDERAPWHKRDGEVTEPVLHAPDAPLGHARAPRSGGARPGPIVTFAESRWDRPGHGIVWRERPSSATLRFVNALVDDVHRPDEPGQMSWWYRMRDLF